MTDTLLERDVASRMNALVGQRYRVPGEYEVGREKIREFAAAVQNRDAAHRDPSAARELGYANVVAPITFLSVLGSIALEHLFEHVIDDYDPGTLLQVDQSFRMHRAVVSGDVLTSELLLESYRQIAGSDMMVIENTIRDHTDHPVVTSRSTFMGRTGARLDPETAAVLRGVMAASSVTR